MEFAICKFLLFFLAFVSRTVHREIGVQTHVEINSLLPDQHIFIGLIEWVFE